MDQRRMMRAYTHFKLFQVNRAVQFMVCNNHANFFFLSATDVGPKAWNNGLWDRIAQTLNPRIACYNFNAVLMTG